MTSKLLLLLLHVFACLDATLAETKILQAVLRGTKGNENVFGLVSVTEDLESGDVTVEAMVDGLADGEHGFHIHTYGDIVGADDGTAAAGHYNPAGVDHAGPDDATRHVGDLGNIESSSGVATYSRTFASTDVSRPTVVGDLGSSIIGRSFVIHADPDDLVSQPTGAAGPRVAVGVIGIGNQDIYNEDSAADTALATEVVEHVESGDFEAPEALVCKIVGDGIDGFGAVTLDANGVAEFRASVTGLTPGPHGYHIHWYGEEYEFSTSNSTAERDLGRAGGHYNPAGVMHGLPDGTAPRHYGDGGNIIADDDGMGNLVVSLPDVTELTTLVGRTCLVHAGEDDGSDPAGNAGPRIAAGQLGYANPDTDISVSVDDSTSGGLVMAPATTLAFSALAPMLLFVYM
eukprot:CAMPEP_0178699092 /NCGR_PEP_ID=MMETSP0699-20121125/10886_1 /TAXON_ID=265572 /ORGANISM="Extubocellulus spinifer, Strain CCMP396" /LENGTH=401 /DNA_ID=CAMNT_0020345197 /DNA_START=308 /DNA_END=1513 /DNA_ORIENTATION=+